MTASNPDARQFYCCSDNRTVTDPIASYVIESIADLRAMSTSLVQENEVAQTLGYYEAGDGGGNIFYWDTTETLVDNNGSNIKAADRAIGRWKALSPDFNVKKFGAKGDDTADDTTYIQAAMTAAGAYGTIFLPQASYYIGGQLNRPIGLNIIGADMDSTFLHVKATSNPALATIFCAASGERWGLFSDFTIKFDQPNNAGVGWADLTQYKPAIIACPTLRFRNITIGAAWDGISFDYYSGSQDQFDKVRIGAFNKGIIIAETSDNVHISKLWMSGWWMGVENSKIYYGNVTPNPTGAGIYVDGQCDGLFISQALFSQSGPAIETTVGAVNPFVYGSGIWFDGQSRVQQASGVSSYVGCNFNGGGQNKVTLSGGKMAINGCTAMFYQDNLSSAFLMDISGGTLTVNGNQFIYDNNGGTDETAIRITDGIVTISDNIFNRGETGSHTFVKPTILKTGGVATIVNNRSTSLSGGTSTFLSITGPNVNDRIDGNIAPGWVVPTEWIAYTPVVTASSGTITTASATGRYKPIGRNTVAIQISVNITNNGTGAGVVKVTLPFIAAASYFTMVGLDAGLTGKILAGLIGGSTGTMNIQFGDATYPGANGAILTLTGLYESV